MIRLIFPTLFLLLIGGCETKSVEQELMEQLQEPSETAEPQCTYKGRKMKVGVIFAASDGCNECQCLSGDKVICTLKECN